MSKEREELREYLHSLSEACMATLSLIDKGLTALAKKAGNLRLKDNALDNYRTRTFEILGDLVREDWLSPKKEGYIKGFEAAVEEAKLALKIGGPDMDSSSLVEFLEMEGWKKCKEFELSQAENEGTPKKEEGFFGMPKRVESIDLSAFSKKDAINPGHYKKYPVEVIDMMVAIFGKEAARSHCLLTAFKYRMRLGHKDAVEQDMKKESWYLNKAEELRE